jgi:isopenicillin N synthase-like dioxygenase
VSVRLTRTTARVPQLAADIRLACTTAGFFFLSGHGIPSVVLDAAFEASRAFFELPTEVSRMRAVIVRFHAQSHTHTHTHTAACALFSINTRTAHSIDGRAGQALVQSRRE